MRATGRRFAFPAVVALVALILATAGMATASTVGTASAALQPVDGAAVSHAAIHAAVDEVLSRPAYAPERSGLLDFLTNNPITRFLAEQWQRFVDWLNSLFEDGDAPTPRDTRAPDPGRSNFGILLLIGVALVAALLAARLARRRTQAEIHEYFADPLAELTTDQLAVAADEAATGGQHELSVRLRFRAGLLTLDRRGIIAYEESEPLGTIRRAVDEPEFDAVANGFERVTYSEHEAEAADSESARSGWSRLLDRRRGPDDR